MSRSRNLMNNISIVAILVLLQNNLICGYQDDTHNVAKRMELENCIGEYNLFNF